MMRPIRHIRAGRARCVARTRLDIGGTNFRAGIFATDGGATADHQRARVVARGVWRHADEWPTRDASVRKLAQMLGHLLRWADGERCDLAPYLGIACRASGTRRISICRASYLVGEQGKQTHGDGPHAAGAAGAAVGLKPASGLTLRSCVLNRGAHQGASYMAPHVFSLVTRPVRAG
jgi:hypothetical protein